MFSDVIRTALEKEVVGQPGAVISVVRGVTRLASGMTPHDRSLCAFMFMGPPGTGKTQLIHSLAKVLHRDTLREVVVDCTSFVHGDPWAALVAQLAPLFAKPRMDGGGPALEAPPLSVIRVEYLERGPKELSRALAAALETGFVMLPEGRRGSLRNCLVFITSSLCSREILDEPSRIGFTPTPDDEGDEPTTAQDRLYKTCVEQAEEHFGGDLVGRLDGLIVFNRLQEEDLAGILDRRIERLNQWLARHGVRCELLPAARELLLVRGRKDLRKGAQHLVRAHMRLVEFPLADLLVSGRISRGGRVVVDNRPGEDHLHFTVEQHTEVQHAGSEGPLYTEIPVTWGDPQSLH